MHPARIAGSLRHLAIVCQPLGNSPVAKTAALGRAVLAEQEVTPVEAHDGLTRLLVQAVRGEMIDGELGHERLQKRQTEDFRLAEAFPSRTAPRGQVRKQCVRRGLVFNSAGRTRTYNQPVNSRLLYH
jgi:hypothetical protein